MTTLKNFLRLTLCLSLLAGCSVDLYRGVEDARVTGSLEVVRDDGETVQILDGELTNGALEQNQVMCATPSLLRSDMPFLVLIAGPDLDLELSVQMIGDSVDADDVDETNPRLIGAISFQGRELEGFEEQPCSFDLLSYDEGGAGTIRMNCPFRDTNTDERFTLRGDVDMNDCFRDRELIFSSDNPVDGVINAASGPDNALLRDLSTVAVLVPAAAVLVGAVFFVGGHGARL